jgi:hypothetical protein
MKENLLEKSKLAQQFYEEGHWVGWDEARVSETESNSRYGKYKEWAHMACLMSPISQPSLDISPIWFLLSAMRLPTHREEECVVTDSSWGSVRF